MKINNYKKGKIMKNKRIYLDCPFSEKDECKSYGAKWDKRVKKWYITKNQDESYFHKWLAQEEIIYDKNIIIYLDVDFAENQVVKNMGALWDSKRCKWYITNNHNKENFKFWMPFPNTENEEISINLEEDNISEELTEDQIFLFTKLKEAFDDKIDQIEDNIHSLYSSVYNLCQDNKIEDDYISEKETPHQEFARHVEFFMEDYDPVSWKLMFRLDPESLAFLELSDESKKILTN